jgi:hypothetical protein
MAEPVRSLFKPKLENQPDGNHFESTALSPKQEVPAPETSKASVIKEQPLEDNPASIFVMCQECFELFDSLGSTLDEMTPTQANERQFDRDLSRSVIQDASSKFKAWAVNIAAFHKPQLRSSLDFRLKEATEIRERIVKILHGLQESLNDGQ